MSAYKRNGVWYVEFVQRGVRVKRSAGRASTKAQAQALERRLRTALEQAQPGPGQHTFDEALEAWLNGEAKGLRDHGLASHIRRVLPYVAGKRLDEGPAAAECIRADLRAANRAAATINRRLAVVRRVLSLAFKWGWIDVDLGRRITLESVRNERKFYVTPAQVTALAGACTNPEAARAIRIAACTGLRRGELLGLDDECFRTDGAAAWLLVRDTKNGHDRSVPIGASNQGLFAQLPLQITPQQLRKQWEKAREKVGLQHLHFHDLRHAFGTNLSGAGANTFQIAALLGHRDHRMSNRYVQRPDEHLLLAVQRLEPAPQPDGDESQPSDS